MKARTRNAGVGQGYANKQEQTMCCDLPSTSDDLHRSNLKQASLIF